jgi:hypothetical protein
MPTMALVAFFLESGCHPGPSSPTASDIAAAYPCDFTCNHTGACVLVVVVKRATDLRCDTPVDRVHDQAQCSFTGLTEDLQTGQSRVQRMSGTYAYRRGKWRSL